MNLRSLVLVTGCALIAVGSVWLVLLSDGGADVAVADRAAPPVGGTDQRVDEPVSIEPVMLTDRDLGTGSREFSGVALNEDLNRLLIVDDEDWLYEFDLASDGMPIVPPRRAVRIHIGARDTEGISWVEGLRYALVSEDEGVISTITLGDAAVTIEPEHVLDRRESGISEVDGSGVEGIAVRSADAERFVVREFPPAIYLVTEDGSNALAELGSLMTDASGIASGPGDLVSVVSDEDRSLVLLAVGDDARTARVDTVIELVFVDGSFPQPEGVVWSRDGSRLYIVGEAASPGGLTFGYFTRDP